MSEHVNLNSLSLRPVPMNPPFRVKVETFVCLGYFRCLDRIEASDYCASREILAIFLLKMHIPFSVYSTMCSRIIFESGYFLIKARYLLIGFLRIELKNAPHLYFPKVYEVIIGDRTEESGFERFHQFRRRGVLPIPCRVTVPLSHPYTSSLR